MASKAQSTLQPDQFKNERAALSQVLNSGCLAKAPALAAILTYICNAFFDGRTEEIKEYTIATEALRRNPDFDQRKDSIVRVEMHRLRKRLRQFYAEDGSEFPLQIDIAVGQYTPVFKPSVLEATDVVVKPQYYGKTVVVRRARSTPGFRTVHPEITGRNSASPLGPNGAEAPGVPASLGSVAPMTTLPLLPVHAEIVSAIPVSAEVPSHHMDRNAPAKRSRWKWAVAAGMAAAVLVGAGLAFQNLLAKQSATAVSLSPRSTVRILAGRETARYLDLTGRVWEGDQFFTGGKAIATRSEATVFGSDPNLFSSRRQGEFTYTIPLKPGHYEARLWFAETDGAASTHDSDRTISVWANGVSVLKGFDVSKDAGGPNITDIRVFTALQPGGDGFLRLRFAGAAFVNALEVFPTDGPKMAPLRIICQPKGHRLADGQYWEPDQFYDGGTGVVRFLPVLWGNDYDLLKGERYGDFQYTLPVASGLYTLNLYFAETWFPQAADRPTHPGNRVFSVECDGVPLVTNLDPANFAHRNYRGFRLSFPHLKAPDGRSALKLRFRSSVNFANVNAIEVLPE